MCTFNNVPRIICVVVRLKLFELFREIVRFTVAITCDFGCDRDGQNIPV